MKQERTIEELDFVSHFIYYELLDEHHAKTKSDSESEDNHHKKVDILLNLEAYLSLLMHARKVETNDVEWKLSAIEYLNGLEDVLMGDDLEIIRRIKMKL